MVYISNILYEFFIMKILMIVVVKLKKVYSDFWILMVVLGSVLLIMFLLDLMIKFVSSRIINVISVVYVAG